VRVIQRVGNLFDQIYDQTFGKVVVGFGYFKIFAQLNAVHKLHDQVIKAVIFILNQRVVTRYMRVGKIIDQAKVLFQPLHFPQTSGKLRSQRFYRHRNLAYGIKTLIHHAHAAAAQYGFDPVLIGNQSPYRVFIGNLRARSARQWDIKQSRRTAAFEAGKVLCIV